MSFEMLTMLLLAAAGAGVLLTLLALGGLRTESPAPPAPSEPSEPLRGRSGAGPCFGWFIPGGGRLGKLRFDRHKEVVGALALDLADSRDVKLSTGIKKKVLVELRRMAWPDQEALFLNKPADPFLLMIDRPLEVFDPRYDRYLIVPLGFMEAAGGLEPFLGALAYDVVANHRDPMDTGEALLRDAAEAAMAAGFAPPDVFKSLVTMLRQQVFAGRYKPFVAMPGGVPGGRPMPPGAGAPPKDKAGTGSSVGEKVAEAAGKGPELPPVVAAEAPPLAAPVSPQAPPGTKKPKPKK